MTITEIAELLSSWENVLVYQASRDNGAPEIAWGDIFFFYAPDGEMPTATQPFATIVTKDYPDDRYSRLDRGGVYRLNIHPGRQSFTESTKGSGEDSAALDTIIEHPVYGEAGWLAVLNPGPQTDLTSRDLLREAYELDQTRSNRRHGPESEGVSR